MDKKIQEILDGIKDYGARLKVEDDDIYIDTNLYFPSDLAREFRNNKDEIRKLIDNGIIDDEYLAGKYDRDPVSEDKDVQYKAEKIDTPEMIDSRHNSIKTIAKINNFIGWICVISIILSPIGLVILIQGHLILAIIEVEHNTRSTNHYLKKLVDKLEKQLEGKNAGEVKV